MHHRVVWQNFLLARRPGSRQQHPSPTSSLIVDYLKISNQLCKKTGTIVIAMKFCIEMHHRVVWQNFLLARRPGSHCHGQSPISSLIVDYLKISTQLCKKTGTIVIAMKFSIEIHHRVVWEKSLLVHRPGSH